MYQRAYQAKDNFFIKVSGNAHEEKSLSFTVDYWTPPDDPENPSSMPEIRRQFLYSQIEKTINGIPHPSVFSQWDTNVRCEKIYANQFQLEVTIQYYVTEEPDRMEFIFNEKRIGDPLFDLIYQFHLNHPQRVDLPS